MSKLDELMMKLCPAGVEFGILGDVVEFRRGKRVVRKDLAPKGERDNPVYQNSLTPLGYYSSSNAPAGSTFIIVAGAAGEIGYSQTDFWAADDCFYAHCPDDIDQRYLYHFLLHSKDILKSRVRKASIPRLARSSIEKLQFPVPPLPVQQEIVRILDMFTQLEAELEAELEVRRNQYDYYRNALFADVDTSGEWQKLGLHGVFQRGSALQKKHLTDKGKPCFHYGEVYTHYGISAYETKSFVTEEFSVGKRVLQPGDLFIATTSENEEDLGKAVAWLGKTPAVASSDALIYRSDLDPRYVSHYFSSIHFNKQKLRYITGTKVKRLSDRALAQIAIPVPQLEKQREVANILDKFDTIVNDLSFGLPAEIVARRKQYEYYRDKLLTFKELSA